MFECSACIRRCIRTLVTDALHPAVPRTAIASRQALRVNRHRSQQRSSYSQAAAQYATSSELSSLPNPPPSQSQSTKASTSASFDTADLQRELRWLPDPLKLADYTVELLNRDEFDKALAIVRLASKNMPCVVSWNHLVDYDMARGHVASAIKTYNEMKKRAQLPDAHTYTTLFRGLAKNSNVPSSLEKTLSIYHSMFAHNSPVKPSIIHTNAVINVCARTGDMDALFGVAAKLPQRGPGAADALTYTMTLNAIRTSLNSPSMPLQSGELGEMQARVVRQSRIISQEIVEKWRKGDLLLDEELVASMGRPLLYGNPRDVDDIFSLVEQTMGVKRQTVVLDPKGYEYNSRKKAWQRRQSISVGEAVADSPPAKRLDIDVMSEDDSPSPDTFDLAAENETKPSLFSTSSSGLGKTLVIPGRNTFSLLLAACARLDFSTAAQDYFNVFTRDPYNIQPDSALYHDYLRSLREKRASSQALAIMRVMEGLRVSLFKGRPSTSRTQTVPMLRAKTFRMGLSTCGRNDKIESSFDHAKQMTRLMLDTLPHIDPSALHIFIHMVLSGHHTKQNVDALAEAAVLAQEGWVNLRSQNNYTGRPSSQEFVERVGGVAVLMLKLYARINALGKEELPRATRNAFDNNSWVIKKWLDDRPADSKAVMARKHQLEHMKKAESNRRSGNADDASGEDYTEMDALIIDSSER